MILVDSSVWIDFFRGRSTREVALLDSLLGVEPVAIGDLMLAEVLQGFVDDASFRRALALFEPVPVIEIGGRAIAVQAARHFRALRARGVTVRKTIDTLIATRCIQDGLPLLYSDRDFGPFVEHLGLRAAAV
jgi:predicted nucleic acid-binding protein